MSCELENTNSVFYMFVGSHCSNQNSTTLHLSYYPITPHLILSIQAIIIKLYSWMSRSRSAQLPNTQNQYLQTNQPNLPPNYRAQATNQLTNDENSNNYSKGQTGFIPQFHDGFIHIELGLDKNKKADVPRSNQTMRPKRSRQIVSHIPNPNNLIVLDVPQNQSNLLQVPGSRFGGEMDSYRVNQQTNRISELEPEKVQVRPKEGEYQSDFLSSTYIDPSRAEKYMQERQKRSEKNTLRAKRQGRVQNPGVYLISVSESVSDNKGMDKAQPLSNQTRDSHNESSSVIVAETAQEAKHTTLYSPPSMGTVSSFVFKREKIFWRSFANPEYTLNTNDGEFMINAKKQYAHFNSYYSISASQKQYSDQQQGYLGYLQGNFTGSQFNLYQQKNGRHELLATIYYVSQFSCSHSYRSIEVYLKHPLLNNLGNEKGSLRDLYSKQQNASSRSIIKLVNKQPVWNAKMECYILDFHKKSKLGSIKNTILVQEDDPQNEVMLFCKTGQHEFLLEMGNPLSPFVAMGVILSSFDFKLCCE